MSIEVFLFFGECVLFYDVIGCQDSDYYVVFFDIFFVDCVVWDCVKLYVDEVVFCMVEVWDCVEYLLEVVWCMGEMDLVVDGVQYLLFMSLFLFVVGLVNMEIFCGDGLFGMIFVVQGGFVLCIFVLFGLFVQQEKWFMVFVDGLVFGLFVLIELDYGLDLVLFEMVVCCDGDSWVIWGVKKWIGNGVFGGIIFVWVCVDDEYVEEYGVVWCFFVEQDILGYIGFVICGKVLLCVIYQVYIIFDDVCVFFDVVLFGVKNFKDVFIVLYVIWLGVVWLVFGYVIVCYEVVFVYVKECVQFGKLLVKFQMVQECLMYMFEDFIVMQLYC